VSLRSLRPSPLVEQAAAQLREQVTGGAWPVGTRLPGEVALAEELGVGRSTVREAIRALAGEGLLQPRQGSGVYVVATSPRPDLATDLRRASVENVYEVRMMIETKAARLAAERRTEADMARIDEALARRRAAAGLPDDQFVDADIALHAAVVAAAGNPVLTALFDQFVPPLREGLVELLRLLGRAYDRSPGDDAHAALAEAVRARDGERADAVLTEEIANTRRLLERAR
jgi:DNA-binding FadR family transcriptional regulator